MVQQSHVLSQYSFDCIDLHFLSPSLHGAKAVPIPFGLHAHDAADAHPEFPFFPVLAAADQTADAALGTGASFRDNLYQQVL